MLGNFFICKINRIFKYNKKENKMIEEVTMYSKEEKANILEFDIKDIDIITIIAKQIIIYDRNPDEVPWIHDIYFAGATMHIVGFFNGKSDIMTFSYNKESVGFFSGGLRKLLSLHALRNLGDIMDELMIKKENKVWEN